MSLIQTTIDRSFGRPDPTRHYRLRQQNKKARPVTGTADAIPSVDEIVDVKNLVATAESMRGASGDAPGPDRVRLSELGGRELFDIFRPVSPLALAGEYRPGEPRLVKIPKASGGYRTLSVGNLVDRVIARALTIAVTPYFEARSLDGSHGFRPGRSPLTMLAALANMVETNDAWVLVSDDICKAFDSVPVVDVLSDLRAPLPADLMNKLVTPIVTGGDLNKTTGIPQGCPFSPIVLNLRLQRAFDERQTHTPGVIPGTPTNWLRYADNLVVACQDVPEGEETLQTITSNLAEAGLTLKGENDGQPVDLRKAGSSMHLLGFTVFRQKNRLQFKLGAGAWDRLVENLKKAHQNPNPQEAAKAVIRGWIDWHGPAFRKRQEKSVQRLTHLAGKYGFADLESEETYLKLCRDAWMRWEKLRARVGRDHHHQHQDVQGQHQADQEHHQHDDRRLRRLHPPGVPATPEAGGPVPRLNKTAGPAESRPAPAVPLNPTKEDPTIANHTGASPPVVPPRLVPRTPPDEFAGYRHGAEVKALLQLQLQMATGKVWFSAREVGLILGVSAGTAAGWCRAGKIRGEKRAGGPGRPGWYVYHAELARYQAQGARPEFAGKTPKEVNPPHAT